MSQLCKGLKLHLAPDVMFLVARAPAEAQGTLRFCGTQACTLLVLRPHSQISERKAVEAWTLVYAL